MKNGEVVINLSELRYGYSARQLVLRDLNLTVPGGAIYGFLGANGAGKSTTIRAMLGLLKPSHGRVQVFGQAMPRRRQAVLSRVGALIEAPALYPHLSGIDNLKIACTFLGLPFSRAAAVLEMVNMQKQGRKLTKRYSTGMKQRLGLALALLNDPDLLILDEPTSGLDPNGIIEIRRVLQRLNESGKTIFLSSHLLSEIEKIATQVGILKAGKMVFEGSIRQLEQLRRQQLSVKVVASDIHRARAVLAPEWTADPIDAQALQVKIANRSDLPDIVGRLTSGGVDLYELTPRHDDLESLFVNLIHN